MFQRSIHEGVGVKGAFRANRAKEHRVLKVNEEEQLMHVLEFLITPTPLNLE